MSETIQIMQDLLDRQILVIFIAAQALSFLGGVILASCWFMRINIKKIESALKKMGETESADE